VGVAVATSPAEQARLNQIAKLKETLLSLNARIEANKNLEKQLRTSQSGSQAKLERAPIRESEMMNLMRDYATLTELHNKLVMTRENAAMTVDLERRQQGEQFMIVDTARLPERPYSPDRMLINLIGAIVGLAVGLALVVLIEYRDATFKADYEVASVLSLPVLAVVPIMRSQAERRADFRKRLLLNLGLGSTVAVCTAVLAYAFLFVR
jgi:uncharacterized protein involved in exopolysaccharide biosynthesis